MPSPVATARQCLSADAAQALDEAVDVAKRRGHGQTTSLHAVSALLSLPSSQLREACLRTRNSVCSSRVQFKALELCLNVSLDRVPSSGQPGLDPPVSNSFMAAIKRSQANQRRQPERFHFYYQQHPTSYASGGPTSAMSCVKVELRNLILSILDDPVVSRVFCESGFRSSDIKLALLRPVPQMFRIPRLKGVRPPPIFCWDVEPPRQSTEHCAKNDNWSVIGDVLVREKRKNPILVGAAVLEVLDSFCKFVNSRKEMSFSPSELSGIRVVSLQAEIRSFLSSAGKKGNLDLNFHEVRRSILHDNSTSGIIMNIGDIKILVEQESDGEAVKDDHLGNFVSELTKLLSSVHCSRKVWITGSLERYEMYYKLVTRFPSIEMDWDLQLLPVSSLRNTPVSRSYPKSSVLESFVPFAGLFSTSSDYGGTANISHPLPSRCTIFNETCEEAPAVSCSSDADPSHPWLQLAALDGKCRLKTASKMDGCRNTEMISVALNKLPRSISSHGISPSLVSDEKEGNEEMITSYPRPEVSVLACSTRIDSSPGEGVAVEQLHVVDLAANSWSSTFPSSDSSKWDLKKLFSFFSDRVGWQDEAVLKICHVVDTEIRPGSRSSKGVWLHFMGPDKYGKEKIAACLAELRCGSQNSVFCTDFACQGSVLCLRSEKQEMEFSGFNTRGKTIIDYIAKELKKKTPPVIFLQNIDKADVQTQSELSSAARSGKFRDSYGRGVVVNNALFVTTSAYPDDEPSSTSDGASSFSERRVLAAKCRPLQIVMEDSSPSSKRKLVETKTEVQQQHSHEQPKRVHSEQLRNLDLNLPAEGGGSRSDSSHSSDRPTAWLQEYLDLVENIHFKAVDFDALADKISKEISEAFHKIAGCSCSLSIEAGVMEQLLAAAYMSATKRAVEDWVEQVLCWGVVQAMKKFNPGSNAALKLVTCESGHGEEDGMAGVFLPRKITLT